MVIPVIAGGTEIRRVFGPVNVSYRFRPVGIAPFVGRTAAVPGLAHKLAPAVRVVRIFGRARRRSGSCGDCGETVEVRIDDHQLVIIVLVRVGAKRAARVRAGV